MSGPHHNFSRRQMLRVGILGSCLTLSDYLQAVAGQGTPAFTSSDPGRSAILVFLSGGPSHQDTFDLKPEAPAEYRGLFRPIGTNVPGIQICEHLPRLAAVADRYAIVRGITHNLADHGIGTRYLMTGNRPTPTIRYPLYGSIASHELPSATDLPAFVSIDRPVEDAGYLGGQYGPLSTGEKPRYGEPFHVRGITLGDGLTIDRYRSQRALLQDLDTAFARYPTLDDSVRSANRFSSQAFEIISSPRARNAFDLSREQESEITRFGKHEFGQSLLLATRLIEAGVRFVTVLLDGWDTHQDNFNELSSKLLPPFDQAMTALLVRLEERGTLDTTSVLVTGEFGRTPKINNNAGRDHWARSMCALMAGGDIRGGQALGATTAKAEEPLSDGFTPDDLAASFLTNLGIDPQTELRSNTDRPIKLVRDGRPIRGLFN